MTPFQKAKLCFSTAGVIYLIIMASAMYREVSELRKWNKQLDSKIYDIFPVPVAEAGETAITKEYLLSLGFEPSDINDRMYLTTEDWLIGIIQTFSDKGNYELTIHEGRKSAFGSVSAHVKDRNHLNQWLDVLGISK